MIYLILTIVSTSFLFIIFKMFDKYKINTFQAVVANYITCVLTGLLFNPESAQGILNIDAGWFPLSFLMGGLFVFIFYIIGLTAQRVGVSVVSIASKISMIIPILFSLFILQNNHKTFDFFNYLGLALSLVAVYFCIKKRII